VSSTPPASLIASSFTASRSTSRTSFKSIAATPCSCPSKHLSVSMCGPLRRPLTIKTVQPSLVTIRSILQFIVSTAGTAIPEPPETL